jgi:hypothetical protein
MLCQTLILTQIISIGASPSTVVKVDPRKNIAKTGETFTINITIVSVQNLYGIDLKLRWNSKILQVVKADVRLGVKSHPDGVLHGDILIAKNETDNSRGKYWLAATSYSKTEKAPPSFNGSGNIVRITFNVISKGNTQLSLETMLTEKPPSGEIASLISHTTINGFFGPIHIYPTPRKRVFVGEKVNISGFIIPARQDVKVAIEYWSQREMSWGSLVNVTTNQQGNYFYVWKPQDVGTYKIRVKAFFENTEETSNSISILVEAATEPLLGQFSDTFLIVALIAAVVTAFLVYYYKRSTSKI